MSAVGVVHWVWEGRGAARVARIPLIPGALLYGAVMRLRAVAYRHGVFATERLALPTLAFGNLSVGGTGKTPLAAWTAAYCAGRGRRPAILLRGYGGDEALVHERLVPGAIVIANPDRVAGARAAQARGADVVVLDDAYQLLGVARDVNVAVVSAESTAGSPWPLPAGPWRERWDALNRADLIVVTRKRASARAAGALADRLASERPRIPVAVASLEPSHLEGMRSGRRQELAVLDGQRVVAAAGIAAPASFGAQLAATGASVQLLAYQDHHPYGQADLEPLVRAAAGGNYVVLTEKDAVKLRGRWPEGTPEPLVAVLSVRWERNGRALAQVVDGVLGSAGRP